MNTQFAQRNGEVLRFEVQHTGQVRSGHSMALYLLLDPGIKTLVLRTSVPLINDGEGMPSLAARTIKAYISQFGKRNFGLEDDQVRGLERILEGSVPIRDFREETVVNGEYKIRRCEVYLEVPLSIYEY